ncbi:type IV secretion protein Rhs [Paenibacillus taichungensis]|uniref:Type IV secretion protein Rhs n=1 Tax=Paenibacillus taichungensis TaxID=484184 RepID=A0ABX2MLF5_9BACL|nr:polymorphic toxin-type HINT domain-containing protein [Paenibacillus taichungensis]NUU54882.1 type IV secretion protein Rhs [Paenibacillus taichungensis]
MKNNTCRKYLTIVLIIAVITGLFGNIVPAVAYAEEQGEQTEQNVSTGQGPSPLDSLPLIAEQFDRTEDFIQGYLDQGYMLNEVITALYKAREEQIGFDEALQAIRPQEINESATVTSDVYTDPALIAETPITGVEADQSGIMQRYETFVVEEELASPPETELQKDEESEEEEDKKTEDEQNDQTDPSDKSEDSSPEGETESTETLPPVETTNNDENAAQTNQDVGQETPSSENTIILGEMPAAEPKATSSTQGNEVSPASTSKESKTISEKITRTKPEKGLAKENKDVSVTNEKQSGVSSTRKQKTKSDVKPLAGQTSTSIPDPGKHIAEKAPVYSKRSFNEAPYTVGENGETISTLSGGLILEHVDASLPGRAGMSFALERQYNSTLAQFYDPVVGTNTYDYPVYNYFLTYQTVKKKIITKYHVKYKLNKWVQEDYNGDGLKDNDTIVVETPTVLQGTYSTGTEARNAANTQIVFWNPAESRIEQQTRSGSMSSLPTSLNYSQGGYSGTLNKSGSAQVISGQYQPARTINAPTQTCTNSIPGKYDAKGNWTQTGTGSPCPETKTATVEGKTITLTRSSVTPTKTCPSPNNSVTANSICTKSWEARYDGSVSVPASDTRIYSQTYSGNVVKAGQYSSEKYDPWIAGKAPYQYRYVYTVREQPWVEQEITEGPAETITLYTDGTPDWSAVNDLKNNVNSSPGLDISSSMMDSGYNYYLASNPSAEIRAYQVGSNTDVTYYNKTVPAAADKRAPLGKGWSWKLPYIETENSKSYVVMTDGGRYEIAGNTLKGYDWEGITVRPDTSVKVGSDVSAQVIVSADGLSKQYFSSDGRLLKLSDSRNNDIQFFYEFNTIYQGKLLTSVKDALGNTIQIAYMPSAVTITQGDRTVTYNKQIKNGVELLDSVIDPLGRKTTYAYKLADAKFNLLGFSPERAVANPYALLTGVQHTTGAKTVYEYENSPVRRYIGADSLNEAYRVLTRKDQIVYENGKVEDYNRQTLSYTSDIGASYGQNATFSSIISSGLTESQSTYRKVFVNNDTPITFYRDRTVVSAEGRVETSTYTYGKTVKNRAYPVALPTVTMIKDNKSNDSLTTTVQYDDYGNVTSMTDATGRTVTSTYDGTRQWLTGVTEMVDRSNKKVTTLTRNEQGDITSIVSRQGSNSGEPLHQSNYTYDTYGNVLTQRISNDTQDQVTTVEYDSRYQQAYPTKTSIAVTDIDGKLSNVSTGAQYSPATGELLSSTDAEGRTTRYQQDALGRTIEVVQTDGSVLRAIYDDIGNKITVTDENGHQRVTQWNALGQQIESGYNSGGNYVVSSRTGYDPYGRTIWSEDALGNRTRVQYDSWNRIISTTGADGVAINAQYNDTERSVTTTDAEGYSRTQTSDMWGNLLQVQEKTQQENSLRTLEKNTYDIISGNLMEQTDGNGNTKRYTYDVLSRLTKVTSPNEEQTTYTYDRLGNLVQTTDAAGQVKKHRYDEMGRRIQSTDKLGQSTQSRYNPDSSLSQFVDRNGNIFTYAYDARGNLMSKSSSEETIRYTVDAVGKRTSMLDQTGTTTYQYDPATEQLTQISYPDGLSTAFTYDLNGNRTSMTNPFGITVFYGYDAMNRLTSVGTTPDRLDAQYSYYLNGLSKEVTLQNGVRNAKQYNGLDLIEMSQKKDEVTLQNYGYGYSYDNNKNIVALNQAGSKDTFTYDNLDRILTSSVNNEGYQYDKQGNRLTLASEAESNISDASYTYDLRNRLTNVRKGDNQVGYTYNGDNLLVERLEKGLAARYYYDDSAQIIAEAEVHNGTPVLKASYIRGAKLDAIQYADGSKAYVQVNGHGDVIELRDSNGEVLNQYVYDIWGNILSKEEKVHNPFRYSGELWDDTTELQYLRARWYNPGEGRFLNEDTYNGELDDPLTQNLYTYVLNNPLRYVDPTGNKQCEGATTCEGDPVETKLRNMIYNKLQSGSYNNVDQFAYDIGTLMIHIDQKKAGLTFNADTRDLYRKMAKLAVYGAEKEARTYGQVDMANLAALFFVGSFKGSASNVLSGKFNSCNCFIAGTKVLTSEGEKNIEDIEVGDKVLAKPEYDSNGELAYKEVTALYRNQRDDIIKLHVGEQLIETTNNHPFWVEGKGWVFADELQVGDKLKKADGSNLTIDYVETVKLDKPVTVYNFTVADFHTYYVTDLGIWVHNTNCFSGSGADLAKLANNSKSNDGLSGTASLGTVNDGAKSFVGSNYTTLNKNGYTWYYSQNGTKRVRVMNKQGKDGILEANFETFNEGFKWNKVGNRLTNYHVQIK